MTARRVVAPVIVLAVGCLILAVNLGVRQTKGPFTALARPVPAALSRPAAPW